MALEYTPGTTPVPHDAPQVETGGPLGLPSQACSVCNRIPNETKLEVYKCIDGSGPYYYHNAMLNGAQITTSIVGQNVKALPYQPCNPLSQVGPIWHVAAVLPTDPNDAQYNYCTDLEIYNDPCVSFPPSGSCINPITNAPYQIGETGPGGGIIFSIPGLGNNQTIYYFEVAPHDVSTTQRDYANLGEISPGDPCPVSSTGLCCSTNANQGLGAEFGVYKEILSVNNGTAIGDGFSNTVGLDSYPTSSLISITPSPLNPVIDTHDLAVKLCVFYNGPYGYTDWFLPSLDEFTELVSNVGPGSPLGNFVGLETSVNMPANEFYWTSSADLGDSTLAMGVKTTSGTVEMERCTTGSVRPVRMFECQVVVPPPPCACNSCSCIEYNYRDYAHCMILGGAGSGDPCGGLVGHLGQGSRYMPGTLIPWRSGTPFYGLFDSIMGNEQLHFSIGAKDVMGNQWNLTDWMDDSIGYTITLWDRWYNCLGKWHYANYAGGSQVSHNTSHPLLPDRLEFDIEGVTHLEGPNPVVNYDIGPNGQNLGSVSKAFFKIEAACNTNLPSAFENGCNHLYGQNSVPYACVGNSIPGYPNNLYWYLKCIATFGTYSIPYSMFPSIGSCWNSPSCRSLPLQPMTSNQGESASLESENFPRIQITTEEDSYEDIYLTLDENIGLTTDENIGLTLDENIGLTTEVDKSKLIDKINQYRGNKEE